MARFPPIAPAHTLSRPRTIMFALSVMEPCPSLLPSLHLHTVGEPMLGVKPEAVIRTVPSVLPREWLDSRPPTLSSIWPSETATVARRMGRPSIAGAKTAQVS